MRAASLLFVLLTCGCAPSPAPLSPATASIRPVRREDAWEKGCRLMKAGDPAGAEAELERWLEQDPKYALVQADLGLLLFSPAREARRDAERAAAAGAEAEGSLLNAFRHAVAAYALSLEGEDEATQAETLVRLWKAASPRPGYPPGLKWHLARAQALAATRRHEEAALAYAQASRFCPWSAEAAYNAAMILGEYQRYAQAVPLLKRALALLPPGPEAQEAEGALFLWETLQ